MDSQKSVIAQILEQVEKGQMTTDKALEAINAVLEQADKTASESRPDISELEERIRSLASKAKRFA